MAGACWGRAGQGAVDRGPNRAGFGAPVISRGSAMGGPIRCGSWKRSCANTSFAKGNARLGATYLYGPRTRRAIFAALGPLVEQVTHMPTIMAGGVFMGSR